MKGPATEGNQAKVPLSSRMARAEEGWRCPREAAGRREPQPRPSRDAHLLSLSLILPRGLGDQAGVSQGGQVEGQPTPIFAQLTETTLFFSGLWVSQRRGQAWRELQWDFPWETLQPGHIEKGDGVLGSPLHPTPLHGLALGSQPDPSLRPTGYRVSSPQESPGRQPSKVGTSFCVFPVNDWMLTAFTYSLVRF